MRLKNNRKNQWCEGGGLECLTSKTRDCAKKTQTTLNIQILPGGGEDFNHIITYFYTLPLPPPKIERFLKKKIFYVQITSRQNMIQIKLKSKLFLISLDSCLQDGWTKKLTNPDYRVEKNVYSQPKELSYTPKNSIRFIFLPCTNVGE